MSVRESAPVGVTEHYGDPMVRILVVEDDLAIRTTLTRGLTDHGAVVTAVGTAVEAIRSVGAEQPDVIMLDEPSRGIDIGAKAEVFRLLAERAREGLAVIYSTSEVGECLSIAHRIIVMHRGRISAEFDSTISKEKIMAASGEAVVA